MTLAAPHLGTTDLIGLVHADPRWAALPLLALAQSAVGEALALTRADPAGYEVDVLACDDARIAALNARFRGKSQPTNVLAWPAHDLASSSPGGRPRPPPARPKQSDMRESLGSIAIAWGQVMREAAQTGTTPADHSLHLLLHGALHLLGYDHETEADAALMETIESQTLVRLGCKDPY